jgi:hypothetical protein
MIPVSDIEYLMVREAEERLASRRAVNELARQAHAKMAELYCDQVWAAREAGNHEALTPAEP